MSHQFRAFSITYQKASLDMREAVALGEEEINRILASIHDYVDVSEMLILSTCNRTEFYYSSEQDLSEDLLKLLVVFKTNQKIASYGHLFERYEGADAVNHLFRVSLGLESQVLGDMQIMSQVKNAYQWTANHNLAGHYVHRLLHAVFFASKRVHQETAFRDGAASTSYASVDLVQHLVTDIRSPKILVLGIGEIGSDVCRNLVDKDLGKVIISNRTYQKAEALAQECGFEARPFEEAQELIHECDVVISSIARDEPFVTAASLNSQDLTSFKYFVDLSVPRSISRDVEDIPGMIVYDIDHIQVKTNEALQKRLQAIPAVEGIIDEIVNDFDHWAKEMEISPTIQKLKGALDKIRNEEIARYLKSASKEESALVEKVTKSMMQKILKLPVLQLKAACKRGEAETLVDVLNDLFDLEKSQVKV